MDSTKSSKVRFPLSFLPLFSFFSPMPLIWLPAVAGCLAPPALLTANAGTAHCATPSLWIAFLFR
jgi:hypothetical protein